MTALIKSFQKCILPETSIAPENRPKPKKKSNLNQPSIFSITLAVNFTEGNIPAIKNSNENLFLPKIQIQPTLQREYRWTFLGLAFWDWTHSCQVFLYTFPQTAALSSENSHPETNLRNEKIRSVKEQVDLGIQLLEIRRWRLGFPQKNPRHPPIHPSVP